MVTQGGPAEAVAAAASGKKKKKKTEFQRVGGEMTEDSAVWRRNSRL